MKLPLISVHIMRTKTLTAKLKEVTDDAAKKGYEAGRHAEATIANHEISKL